jgi:hypothetical protein
LSGASLAGDNVVVAGAEGHGVGVAVRLDVRRVGRELGRDALELEVRRRGFHLLECGGDFGIVCSSAPIRIVC